MAKRYLYLIEIFYFSKKLTTRQKKNIETLKAQLKSTIKNKYFIKTQTQQDAYINENKV